MKTPNLFSENILPFTALLGTFEALLVWYWVGLKLGEVLTYGAILTVPTVYFGRKALYTLGQLRLGSVKK
jgi:oligosaccharyltransferase complex subunit delta (ribophorin II)